MAVKKKKVGRPKVKAGDQVKRTPLTAMVKHHKVIKEQLQPIVDEFVAKIETNGQQ
jgi:hypothetical protein